MDGMENEKYYVVSYVLVMFLPMFPGKNRRINTIFYNAIGIRDFLSQYIYIYIFIILSFFPFVL